MKYAECVECKCRSCTVTSCAEDECAMCDMLHTTRDLRINKNVTLVCRSHVNRADAKRLTEVSKEVP